MDLNKRERAERKACVFLFGQGSGRRLPDFFFYNSLGSYQQELDWFKRLFNSGDPELRFAAWNALWFDKLPQRGDFTDEEYAFLQEYAQCEENMIFCQSANPNKHFSSARLILRPAEENYGKELSIYHKHLKEDGDFTIYTCKKLTKTNMELYNLSRPYCFCVYEKTSGNLVGMTGLYGYDEAKRMATAEWYIFKPYRGKGYAKEAITTLAKRAFDGKLFEIRETAWRNKYRRHFAKIDLIRADIRETNIPSQKTAESCGFQYQYTDHRHFVVEGEGLEDAKVYELTPETIRIK